MKTVILAGGFGTRLAEMTANIPKPMVEIGSKPILWHILNIYAAFGHREFLIALGYKGDVIKKYFLDFRAINNDLSFDLARGKTEILSSKHPDWLLHLIDTGATTQTGGRIKRLHSQIRNEPFMLTYGDGVANINISSLIDFHRKHGKLATITAVRPSARFGGLVLDGQKVVQFTEKNQVNEGWINGGFFVLNPAVLDYIEGDQTVWEKEPLERLAADGQLMAYFHDGFWQPMDTLREQRLLESLWNSGMAPWKIWNESC